MEIMVLPSVVQHVPGERHSPAESRWLAGSVRAGSPHRTSSSCYGHLRARHDGAVADLVDRSATGFYQACLRLGAAIRTVTIPTSNRSTPRRAGQPRHRHAGLARRHPRRPGTESAAPRPIPSCRRHNSYRTRRWKPPSTLMTCRVNGNRSVATATHRPTHILGLAPPPDRSNAVFSYQLVVVRLHRPGHVRGDDAGRISYTLMPYSASLLAYSAVIMPRPAWQTVVAAVHAGRVRADRRHDDDLGRCAALVKSCGGPPAG